MFCFSQVVELVSERSLVNYVVLDLLWVHLVEILRLLNLCGVANSCEQISNLMGVHAGSRHFDGTGPVEVVMAQGKCQVLQLNFG